jgi:hypothetical protein
VIKTTAIPTGFALEPQADCRDDWVVVMEGRGTVTAPASKVAPARSLYSMLRIGGAEGRVA